MNKISCPDIYRESVKVIAFICASMSTISVIITVALIIPNNIFMMGELWGIGIHRYKVITCSGLISFLAVYFAAKFFCCWRCPGLPEKTTKEQKGFMFII